MYDTLENKKDIEKIMNIFINPYIELIHKNSNNGISVNKNPIVQGSSIILSDFTLHISSIENQEILLKILNQILFVLLKHKLESHFLFEGLSGIIENIELNSIVDKLQYIFERIFFILNSNTSSIYLAKIECCHILSNLFKLIKSENNFDLIKNFYDEIISVLKNACNDRVAKVQIVANECLKIWLDLDKDNNLNHSESTNEVLKKSSKFNKLNLLRNLSKLNKDKNLISQDNIKEEIYEKGIGNLIKTDNYLNNRENSKLRKHGWKKSEKFKNNLGVNSSKDFIEFVKTYKKDNIEKSENNIQIYYKDKNLNNDENKVDKKAELDDLDNLDDSLVLKNKKFKGSSKKVSKNNKCNSSKSISNRNKSDDNLNEDLNKKSDIPIFIEEDILEGDQMINDRYNEDEENEELENPNENQELENPNENQELENPNENPNENEELENPNENEENEELENPIENEENEELDNLNKELEKSNSNNNLEENGHDNEITNNNKEFNQSNHTDIKIDKNDASLLQENSQNSKNEIIRSYRINREINFSIKSKIKSNLNNNNHIKLPTIKELSKILNITQLVKNLESFENKTSNKIKNMNEKIDSIKEKINNLNKFKNNLDFNLINESKIENKTITESIINTNKENNFLTRTLENETNQTSPIIYQWQMILKELENNNINKAFEEAIQLGDDILLLRLIFITGPCLDLLDKEINLKLLMRCVLICRCNLIQQNVFEFIKQSVDLKLFNNLKLDDQNEILEVLDNFSVYSNPISERSKILYKQILNL